ncbi:condensation domain-containing protein, partial [Undibacterium sp. TJN19]|uniref:condensation domain-containing protein n=1 Tax=Undibacterium sp. TJN19 TaxID=3413055 RepID=UPI003BEF90AA
IDVEPLQVSEEQGVARYDLTFNFSVQADGSLLGSMEYNTDLFKAETIERLLKHYERLLEAVVAAPQEAIGELDFLSDAERQQQLQDWNPAARTDSPQRPTSTQSVHTL